MKYSINYVFALIVCILLIPIQANACLGWSLEDTLFFDKISGLPPEADVIASVALTDVSVVDNYKGMAIARVLKVIRVGGKSISPGDLVSLRFMFSSCGPNHRSGQEGMIVAKMNRDSHGRLVLYPYMRRYSDDRIEAPCPGRLLGNIDDACVRK